MHGITTDHSDAAGEGTRRDFGARLCEHCASEVDAEDPLCPTSRARRGNGDISGSSAHIQEGLGPGERERTNGTTPPITIEPCRQHRIEQVVAWRDRIEHSGNARCRFVQ